MITHKKINISIIIISTVAVFLQTLIITIQNIFDNLPSKLSVGILNSILVAIEALQINLEKIKSKYSSRRNSQELRYLRLEGGGGKQSARNKWSHNYFRKDYLFPEEVLKPGSPLFFSLRLIRAPRRRERMLSGAEKPKRGPGRPPKAISEKRSKQEKILADANTSILANEESIRSQSIKNRSVRVKSKEPSTPSESELTTEMESPVIEKKWTGKKGEGFYFPPTSSAYEVLGLQSKEPGSRPPILHMGIDARPFMNWAANDCARSMALLRRARPVRTLSASFFDRIEVLRKVILAEIAKSGDTLTAMAVVGVVLDREALLLSAEEIYGPTKAKDMILDESPGNYPDIATELDQARRTKRRPMRRETGRGAANTQKMSKQSSPYFTQKPFQGRGVKVLQLSWRPGKESMCAFGASRRRWSCWSNECSVEGMEEDGRSEVSCSMVKARGSIEVEGPSTDPGSEVQFGTAQGSREGDRQTYQG